VIQSNLTHPKAVRICFLSEFLLNFNCNDVQPTCHIGMFVEIKSDVR